MLPSLAQLSLDPGEAPTGARWYRNTKGVEITSDDSDRPHAKLYAKKLGPKTKDVFVWTLGGTGWVYAGAHFEKPRSLADETTFNPNSERNLGGRNSKMDKVRFYTTADNASLYVQTSFEHTPSDNYWKVPKDSWFEQTTWELIIPEHSSASAHDYIKGLYEREHAAHGVKPKLITILKGFWKHKESLSKDPNVTNDFFNKMALALDRRLE